MLSTSSFSHSITRNSRRVWAICAIALSLVAALTLATVTTSTTTIWVTTHQIAPGVVLSTADITKVGASLGGVQSHYYSSTARIIGNVVTRPIGGGEFIPLNALAQAGSVSDYRQLPIGIAKSDLPSDLAPGDRVDLYSVPKDSGGQPTIVATGIRVQGVDNKSRDLGGAVSVLFLLHEREVMPVVDSLISGRIVVVRNAL
jgi:hypothetical protein